MVVAHDWLSAMGGITVKRETGLPFAFHVHSTEKGRTLGNGSSVVSNIELRAGNMADMVVTVSYAMKDELSRAWFSQRKNSGQLQRSRPTKIQPRKRIPKEDIQNESALNMASKTTIT